jgi:hypothetical protein
LPCKIGDGVDDRSVEQRAFVRRPRRVVKIHRARHAQFGEFRYVCPRNAVAVDIGLLLDDLSTWFGIYLIAAARHLGEEGGFAAAGATGHDDHPGRAVEAGIARDVVVLRHA